MSVAFGLYKSAPMAIFDGFDVPFEGFSMRCIALPSLVIVHLKIQSFNMLNILYTFTGANKYDYLYSVKVSYYGRKRTNRYRTHGNAGPLCDESDRGLVA